MTTYSKD